MADASLIGGDVAVTFMVTAGLVYEIVAAACSSPQTAEINAKKRSATLMKWVKLGLAQSVLFVLIAIMIAENNRKRWAAAAGGGLAGALLGLSYLHANKAGLASGEPGTESY
ncbi:MAG TPA: hypothetical protein VGG75_42655 [Trebonia sp.]